MKVLIDMHGEIALFKKSAIQSIISRVKNSLGRNYLIAKSAFADFSNLPLSFLVVISRMVPHPSEYFKKSAHLLSTNLVQLF